MASAVTGNVLATAALENQEVLHQDTSRDIPHGAVAGGGDDHLSPGPARFAPPRRAPACAQYPSGHSRPVGNMQKWRPGSHGGVWLPYGQQSLALLGGCRAPMTYVGPKSYDASSNAETWPPAEECKRRHRRNPRSESDVSGVINLPQCLRRTGPTAGVYKGLDPLGELCMKVCVIYGLHARLAPSDITGANVGRKDGYPGIPAGQTPLTAAPAQELRLRLRNSILTIAEQNTHSDKSLLGSTRRQIKTTTVPAM